MENMRVEDARSGIHVRVGDQHRIARRRGMVGKVVGRYGGDVYVALDVRFPNGEQRLFSPTDLIEEAPAAEPSWWRTLIRSA
jgi:hypothetical protein